MNRKPSLMLVKCEEAQSIHDLGVYFLVETYLTSEGLRTRVCSGRWKELSEAQEALRQRREALK